MSLPYTLFAAILAASSLGEAGPPARDPGAIVLLAESEAHAADEELRAALLDPDRRIRLVAARVTGVGAHTEMLGSIIGALLREQDPDTGTELLRAALYLGGHRDLALIDAQAKRLGRGAQLAKAEWLARVQPSRFLAALPDLVREPEDGIADLVQVAAVQHPQLQSALFDAWMRLTPERGWGYLLERIYAQPVDLRDGATVFVGALASARPSVREETVWFLVGALRDERKIPNDVLDAALPTEGSPASEWETFGRELIARHRQHARTPDRAALIAAASGRQNFRWALTGLAVLTKTEREALGPVAAAAPMSAHSSWRLKQPPMRTIALPAAGVIGATLDAAGCKRSEELAGAALEYFPDGRPRTIKVDPGRLLAPCVRALSALSRLSIAERGYPVAGDSQLVVLPFHDAFFSCSSQPDEHTPPAVVGTGKISTPRKTRDVRPYYPEDAQQQRIQGVVVLEATISRHGCIQAARVLRSIPRLDVPALWAVTQWQFEPTRLDGVAVPVVMTVTVNFQLR